MADENEGASRTEEPTQRKLEQAREKGDVVRTPDLGPLASLVAAGTVVALMGSWLSQDLMRRLTPFLAQPDAISLQGGRGLDVARMAMMAAAPTLAAVMGAAALAGVAGNLMQTGLILTTDKLKPDLSRLSI